MNDSKILLAIIGIVLVTSGCTSNGSEDSSQGLQINEFTFTPSIIQEGQSGNLELTVENTGNHQPEFATARIQGPSFTTSNPDSSDTRWYVTSATSGNVQELQESLLLDVKDDQPGGTTQQVWTARFIDSIAEDRTIDDTWDLELLYNYLNPGSTTLEIISQNTYAEEQPTRTRTSASNKKGPIQLDINARTPLVYDSEEEDTNVSIAVEVTNEGSGEVYHPSVDEFSEVDSSSDIGTDGRKNKVCVRLADGDEQIGSVSFENPSGVDSEACQGESGVGQQVNLIDGDGRANFVISLNNPDRDVSLPVRFEAHYSYLIEDSAPYTVQGALN